MIVGDTNLIVYLLINGEKTSLAEQVWLADSTWVAPILWRSEFRNVLSLYFRKEILTIYDIQQLMNKAEQMMAGNEYHVASSHVLSLIVATDLSAYDCEFVALANDLSVPLITNDKKILRLAANRAVSPVDFLKN